MGFSKDFVWGVATSSYQIEGAHDTDGRTASVWDTFCRRDGCVYDKHNGDVACDHYHKFKEDVAIMKQLGVSAYRFSVSWSRVLPNGTGDVNEAGIAFYNKLIDELLANNITPYLTVFHWDFPQILEDKGGWKNPDSPKWFEEYAALLAKRFGDRVKHWFTLNEPQVFIGLGHFTGEFAPGLKLPIRDCLVMSHNVLLAHGRSVVAIRNNVPNAKIGYAPTGRTYYPHTKTPENIDAARLAQHSFAADDWYFSTSFWSDPVVLGRYSDDTYKHFEADMPRIGQDDMNTISQPLDFYGQNIYNSIPVEADGNGGFKIIPFPEGYPRTAIGWAITPEGMYWGTKFLSERYKLPIYITENGLSCHDVVSLDGKVHDPNRIDFLHRYLKSLRTSAEDGVNIAGYFQWSLLDNFEWSKGYSERFGIVHVDYATQKRIIKDSGMWYSEVVKANGENL